MLFTNSTQWIALVITLVAGWFLGMASNSGGKKWKRRMAESERSYLLAHKKQERELHEARERILALEAELDTLRAQHPGVAASTIPLSAAAAAGTTSVVRDRAAERDVETEKTWIPEAPPRPSEPPR